MDAIGEYSTKTRQLPARLFRLSSPAQAVRNTVWENLDGQRELLVR